MGGKERIHVHTYIYPPYRQPHTPHRQGHASLIYHSNKHPPFRTHTHTHPHSSPPPCICYLSCTSASDLLPLCSPAEVSLIYSEQRKRGGRKKERKEKEEEMRSEILALRDLGTSADEFRSAGISLASSLRARKLITSLGNSKGNYD